MEKNFAVVFQNITKRFGQVVANNNINFGVKKGEILSLLGENGSGKTTLMNMLSGIYFPDDGKIFINGEEALIASPIDAFKYKIGMIHQHFKLVDIFTASQNVVLGLKEKYNLKSVDTRVAEIADRYGFEIDPKKKIYDMSVSEKQTVEIIKVLYRGADILILDEPTAVLTPQETQQLFAILRKMRADGKSIIIITHKLNEVMEISDRVAILRKGEYITTVDTSATNEKELDAAVKKAFVYDSRVLVEKAVSGSQVICAVGSRRLFSRTGTMMTSITMDSAYRCARNCENHLAIANSRNSCKRNSSTMTPRRLKMTANRPFWPFFSSDRP